jgi:Skp family chaperone for outer membrane proteins
MKKTFILSILILTLSFPLFANRNKIAKICYVNTEELLEAHPLSRNVIAEMKSVHRQFASEIAKLTNEVRELEKKVQANVSQNELRTILAKLEAKKEALNDEISKRNKKLFDLKKNKLQPVYKQILEDIKKFASSLGYNLVIDSRYILIGVPDLNITEELKRIFLSRR